MDANWRPTQGSDPAAVSAVEPNAAPLLVASGAPSSIPRRAAGSSIRSSVDSTAQAGHAGAGDSQEEIYQMIKSLKDQYFAELSELYNKISVKLQHVDSMIPPQRPSDQYERMKSFKIMLERILQFLQFNKSNIQPALRDKIPQYEKQIISILNSQRRRPVQQTQGQQQCQPPAAQAPSSSNNSLCKVSDSEDDFM